MRVPLPLLALLLVLPAGAQAGTSELWGAWGERWAAGSRLPDFTHAGYRAGAEPIPDVPVVANLLDYGAVPDGATDSSAALRAALADMPPGALLLPAGRYRLLEQVVIDRSDVVLRGEGDGPDGTVLVLPRSLADLFGPRAEWSWNGGLLELRPPDSPAPLTAVAAEASRGDRTLEVADPAGIEPGAFVRLVLRDDEAETLGAHLHAEQTGRGHCSWQEDFEYVWTAQVAAVQGTRVTLAQPLRTDVRPEWRPWLTTAPALREVGLESLRFEFPELPYAGHHDEPGYNAVFARGGLHDAWIRDVTIVHADNGILLDRDTKRVTVQDVRLAGRDGHHGLQLAFTHDSLVQRVHTDADWIHAGTLDHRSSGNVWRELSASSGPWEMDHHRDASLENLWTAIETEVSWASSGSVCAGPHSGARSTFWGLQRVEGVPLLWGFVQTTVVGMLTVPDERSELGAWYEHVPDLEPADLLRAQRERAAGIADRTGAFAEGELGRRAAWTEDDPRAWILARGGYGTASLRAPDAAAWTVSELPLTDGNAFVVTVVPAPPHPGDPPTRVAVLFEGNPEAGSAVAVGPDVSWGGVIEGLHAPVAVGDGAPGTEPFELELGRRGSRLTLRVDGALLLDLDLGELDGPGGPIALGVLEGAALFDDPRVEPLPEEPGACSEGCGAAEGAVGLLPGIPLLGRRRRRSERSRAGARDEADARGGRAR